MREESYITCNLVFHKQRRDDLFGKLHKLVNEARGARDAGNLSLMQSKWFEAQEEINMLPGYEPSVRERFGNLLYDHVAGSHAGSSDIDPASFMDLVKKNPEAGKREQPPPGPVPY